MPSKIILSALLLSMSIALHAQISKGGMLLNGQFQFEGVSRPDVIGINLAPALQYSFSNKLSIGGRATLNASFDNGLQAIVFEPQIRYYFNPYHPRHNWFAFIRSFHLIDLSQSIEFDDSFQLFTGVGWGIFLTPNVVLESKLGVNFNRQGSSSLFESPIVFFESGLLLYLNWEDRNNDSTIKPNIGKNRWMIGGSTANAFRTAFETSNVLNLSIQPRLGYFVSNHLLLGLGIPFSQTRIFQESVFNDPGIFSKITAIGVAPFIRLYPGKKESRLRPFIDLNTSYIKIYTILDNAFLPIDDAVPSDLTSFGFNGGFNLFVSATAALEASFYFNRDVTNAVNRTGIQLGFQFFLSKTR